MMIHQTLKIFLLLPLLFHLGGGYHYRYRLKHPENFQHWESPKVCEGPGIWCFLTSGKDEGGWGAGVDTTTTTKRPPWRMMSNKGSITGSGSGSVSSSNGGYDFGSSSMNEGGSRSLGVWEEGRSDPTRLIGPKDGSASGDRVNQNLGDASWSWRNPQPQYTNTSFPPRVFAVGRTFISKRHPVSLGRVAPKQVAARSKIDDDLLQKMELVEENELVFNVMVQFKPMHNSFPDLSLIPEPHLKSHKMVEFFHSIIPPNHDSVRDKLKELKFKWRRYLSLWISNHIYFERVSKKMILTMDTADPELSKFFYNITNITEEKKFRMLTNERSAPLGHLPRRDDPSRMGKEWIGADAWIAKKWDGRKVIVGHIGGGVDAEHPELHHAWLGPHYGWWDATEPKAGKLKIYDPYYVDGGTGTEALSVVVGERTGIAPRAKWISCLIFNEGGIGTEHAALECGQYMVCPNPEEKCTKRPQVILNTWGRSSKEKEIPLKFFDTVIQIWDRGYQTSVFPAGDEGVGPPPCHNIFSPADSVETFGVGMTEGKTNFSTKSGKGPAELRYPTAAYYPKFLKPDLVAPGIKVATAFPMDRYALSSGTSIAAAYIAGSAALMISRNQGLNFTMIKGILLKSAVKEGFNYDINEAPCPIQDVIVPNYKVGHGFIRLPDPMNTTALGDPDPPE